MDPTSHLPRISTKNGALYRVPAMDGIPLTRDQRQQDNARIDRLLHDTSQQSKLKQQYNDDEEKLETLMRVMPQAFLYDYDGVDGNFVRLRSAQTPRYKPPNYEARVVHSLAGTVLIDPQTATLGQTFWPTHIVCNWLGDLRAHRQFGRIQVGLSQWKTALNIQLSGL